MLSRKRFNAKVELRTKNPKVVYSALKPDIDSSFEGHTKAEMKLEDNEILLEVTSDDLSHLRASLNSYLRLAKTAINCLDVSL